MHRLHGMQAGRLPSDANAAQKGLAITPFSDMQPDGLQTNPHMAPAYDQHIPSGAIAPWQSCLSCSCLVSQHALCCAQQKAFPVPSACSMVQHNIFTAPSFHARRSVARAWAKVLLCIADSGQKDVSVSHAAGGLVVHGVQQ